MKKLLVWGAAVLVLAAVAGAVDGPGNELFHAWYVGDNADTHRFRAVDCDSTQGTAHTYFHATWSFYNQSDSQAIIALYRLDGTTGAKECSLIVNIPAGTCWNPPALFDSARVVPAAAGDSVHVTITGDLRNGCDVTGAPKIR